jgi:outer membrane receptor for ferrienterochelin and colicins
LGPFFLAQKNAADSLKAVGSVPKKIYERASLFFDDDGSRVSLVVEHRVNNPNGHAIVKIQMQGCTKQSRRLLLAAFLGLAQVLPMPLVADDETPLVDDALQALLGALQQETEIATRTKMNVDFVPGMVSVLYGKDLLDRGVRDVGDALALIPGIETSISNDGVMQVLVRGVGAVFSSGKIKILLNGVAFNGALSAASTALAIPSEQIERIEVIRGPGSTIYGEFAYSGVVNIITRKKQDQVFARYGHLGQKTLGGVLSRGKPGEDWHTSLSFSGTNLDGGVTTGPGVLRIFPDPSVTRAPGESNEKEVDRNLILHTEYRAFDLSVQWAKVDSGDYFGLAQALPGIGQSVIRKVDMLAVDAGWEFLIGKEVTGRARVGWLDYTLNSGLHQLYPAGFFIPGVGAPGDFPQGVFASPNYEERKYYAGLEFNYSGMPHHEWLLGFDWSFAQQGDAFAQRNFNPATFAPMPLAEYTGSENWLEEDLQRRLWAILVQDQFAVNDRLTITAGIRFDSYDDVGDAASPRLAGVYQLSAKETLKAQFAQAFRPPTFLETSTKNNPIVRGNPELESETIQNYELGYVFNDGVTVARATLFFADLLELIVIDVSASPNSYTNKGEVHVDGIEFEYIRKFGRSVTLDGNLTLQDADDESDGDPVADVASVLANAGVAYRLNRQLSASAQYRYVGGRERADGDPRANLDAYQTIDLTIIARQLLAGMTIRGGVKNLLDEAVLNPSPLTNFGGAVIPSYPQDYPRPGREYWLQADVQF